MGSECTDGKTLSRAARVCYITPMLKFTKMNGAGNDFVVLDNRQGALQLDRESIARLCDRQRGIGSDGLLMVEPAVNGADFRMRYFNNDGGEAEMCGNGARCFARFAQRLSGKGSALNFETLAGVISAEFPGENVRIAMSAPRDLRMHLSLPVQGESLTLHAVNTGVPHAVIFVDDLENTDVRRLGAGVRFHEAFAPKGTNVNFAKSTGPRELAIRTYERGVEDETLACGTGMVASALVFHELSGAASPVGVRVRGGDRLEIAFEKNPAGGFEGVTLTGPADFVFEGEIAL